MHLDFEQIAIQGFTSWRGNNLIDLKAYGTGLHFIRGKNQYKPRMGPNGVGKSAIWNALLWALYGYTVEGLRNPDIKPWSGKHEPTSVTVWVSGQVITRTASPNKLLLNDEPVGQDKIDALIGLSKEVFCHTILLGQGMDLFLDLKPKDKMDVFNSVLNLDKWDDRAKAASAKVSALQKQVDVFDGQVVGIKSGIEQLSGVLADARKKSDQWEQDNKVDERAQLKQLKTLKAQIASKSKLRDDADLAYDGAATEANACEKEIDKIQEKITINERDAAKASLAIDAVVTDMTAKIKRRDQMKIDKTCPTCGQTMRNVTNLKKHVAELTAEISKCKARREELLHTELEHNTLIKRLERKLDQQRGFMKDFTAKAETAEAALSLQKNDIADLEGKVAVIEQLMERAQSAANPYHEQIKTLIRKKNTMKAEAAELERTGLKLTRRIERTKFWVKGFKDVQLYVVDEVLQELELVSNAMLSEMGLDDWEIRYAVEKETKSGTIQRGLNVTVLSPDNDKPVRWECWSGGEGQRLRVLGALALSEVLLNHAGVTTSLEILDEPTRGLSDEGVHDLCKYLALRAEQLNKQCWLIDHAAIPSTSFTSTLTVLRDRKGVSRLLVPAE